MVNDVVTAIADEAIEREDVFQKRDPFNKPWDDLKSYAGLDDPNAKRRITRKAASAFQTNVTPRYESESMMQPTGAGAQSKQINPGKDHINGYGAFDVITPPHNLYQLANFYDTNFANHAAVDAKVMNIVGAGYSFVMTPLAMRKASEAKEDKDIQFINRKVNKMKSDVSDWLDSLNDSASFTDTMRRVVTDLEATGNGYLEIGRTANGKIGYVGHVPSITMRVRRLRDGFVQIIGTKVVYFRNFKATNKDPLTGDSQPNEIIHLKKYSPLNTYYGVPDITSAISSLVGDQMAEEYNIDYFSNKAVPRYLIKMKGMKLSHDSEQTVFDFFQSSLKGNHHRTLIVPVPPDEADNKPSFEIEAVENKIQDSSFKEYRKSNRDNILMAHQVPLSKLGSADASAVASAIAQDRTFRDQVCRPMQREIEKSISIVVAEHNNMVKLAFNEMNIVDEVQQSTMHKTYADIGAMLPNEIREEIGRPTIEGLDDKKERLERERMEMQARSVRERQNERVQQQSDGHSAAAGRNPKGSGSKEDGNNV